MDKTNESIKAAPCIKGGSKEAAIKVREVLKNIIMQNDSVLLLDKNNAEDFLQAVRKLVVFAESRPDTYVPLFYCEEDCAILSCHKCLIKPSRFKEGTEICPMYIEEDK